MGQFYRGRNTQAPIDPESIRLHLLKQAEREKAQAPKQKVRFNTVTGQWEFVQN